MTTNVSPPYFSNEVAEFFFPHFVAALLMLRVKLPVVDRIHLQSNKFATGVENKASCTGDSKVNDSPYSVGLFLYCRRTIFQTFVMNFFKTLRKVQ